MTGWLRSVHPQTLRVTALALVLALVVLFFGSQIDNYYTARMFNRISTSVAIILLIAIGQALVVITRNIDLSVGSIVGFTAYLVGDLLVAQPDLHPLVVVAAAMALGAALGAVNGVVVAYGRVPAIIVTLGTLAIYRTILVEYSDARSITTANLPKWVVELPQATLFSIGDLDIRVTVAIALGVALVVHLALTRLRAARRLYAVGSNPDAAAIAGINAERVVFTAFLLSGALAGLAGFVFLARFGNITVVAGLGFELKSVAAVVVGGVNIFGGSGTVVGVVLGTTLVDVIDNSLTRWALVSEFWRDALLGMLILIAVAADTLMNRYLDRLRRKRHMAELSAGTLPVPREAG
ncbi:MAG: ABC transporter permease [Geminicoccaceae bacterium]|jgi:rhamnose transport system permease protein|nr:ABC transporter permease [Geminicoccaceae bacterium]HRY24615.1 ABC transporter permease [Geminicoccaceae bacterium]